jgi:site-specific recombinase XerD
VLFDRKLLFVEPVTSLYLTALVRGEKGRDAVSLATAEAHAFTLCQLINEIDKDPFIEHWKDITDEQMNVYLEIVLLQNKGVSPNTVHQYIERLKSFFGWCVDNSWFPRERGFSWQLSPGVMRDIKRHKSQARSLDPFNLPKKYIEEHDFVALQGYKVAGSEFEQERDGLILDLGYYSGFRAAETTDPDNLSIKKILAAIESTEKLGKAGIEINIIGKGANGGKTRETYIPEQIKNKILRFIRGSHLRATKGNTNILICKRDGTPIRTRSHASKVFNKAKKNLIKSGNKQHHKRWTLSDRKVFHCLRHSYATNLASWCYDNDKTYQLVQDRLGHSDFSTTKIYIHFSALLRGDTKTANEYIEQMPAHLRDIIRRDFDA